MGLQLLIPDQAILLSAATMDEGQILALLRRVSAHCDHFLRK
jgi:hypothetical protein